jgi:hypothetical protein
MACDVVVCLRCVLAEIALVGLLVMTVTTWPLWREYLRLKRETDEKAREVLERSRCPDNYLLS